MKQTYLSTTKSNADVAFIEENNIRIERLNQKSKIDSSICHGELFDTGRLLVETFQGKLM
jgi:hypothetical protein